MCSVTLHFLFVSADFRVDATTKNRQISTEWIIDFYVHKLCESQSSILLFLYMLYVIYSVLYTTCTPFIYLLKICLHVWIILKFISLKMITTTTTTTQLFGNVSLFVYISFFFACLFCLCVLQVSKKVRLYCRKLCCCRYAVSFDTKWKFIDLS